MTYRPWGPVDWVLSLSSPKTWDFVGSIGTTERSLTCWKLFNQKRALRSYSLARINDVDSEKYRDITTTAFEVQLREFVRSGGRQDFVRSFDLMAELFQILEFAQQKTTTASSIVFDITAFPKRFFFPMLRTFVQSTNVKNLLLTYTSPASYTDEALYEDPEPWRALPGFSATIGPDEHFIVSVGFLVESLRQYLGDNPDHERMKLLIPYPAPLGILRRTSEALVRLEGGQLECGETNPRFEKFRIDTLDMSTTFSRIVSLANATQRGTAFAPFGPKPMSAAMCLYATAKGSPVYYPQPTVYHPNYAIGIRGNDPDKAVTAYWVKHEGENLYVA